MASPIKGIPVAPLTGVLDLRSSPDAVPAGGLRYRLNFQTIGENKLRRGTGWSKYLTNNGDFHDQLLIFSEGIRQPITLLYDAVSTQRTRTLFLATQSQIAMLNGHAGNWRVLGHGFGGEPSTSAAAPRFKVSQNGDYVVFTNDVDRPQYHILGQGGDDLLQEFEDLVTIGVTRAAVTWTFGNCTFFGDLELDGRRQAHMFIWSDFDNPSSLDPAKTDSIAGSQELYPHERILAARPSGGAYLIYTTHGIWELSIVGGERSFAVRRVYNAEDNEGHATLKYPNTLVGLKDAHLYAAEDGFYVYNQFYNQPERVEWIHRATPWVYDNIDSASCTVHVGAVNGDEAYFSFAKVGEEVADLNQCPVVTLRLNTAYKVADLVDAGFTCFANARTYDVPTIRDFIIENEICTLDELIESGFGYGEEGIPNPLPVSTAEFTPQSIFTSTPKTEIWGPIGAEMVTVSRERTSNQATIEVTGHGLTAGDHVAIYNLGGEGYNVADAEVLNVPDADTFIIASTGDDESNEADTDGRVQQIEPGTAVIVEDYEQEEADEDSLCALMDGLRLDDICRGCETPTLLIAAASRDWCIKEIGRVFYREICDNPEGIGQMTAEGYVSSSGLYSVEGYDSILRTPGAYQAQSKVIMQRVLLYFLAAPTDSAGQIGLRVGIGAQVSDPNTPRCPIRWNQLSLKDLTCLGESSEGYLTTQPSNELSWQFHYEGKVLFAELKISGTGADSIFSGFLGDVKTEAIRRY